MEEKKILEELNEKFPQKIRETSKLFGDVAIVIERESLFEIVAFLKNKPYECNMLLDLTCVDYKGQEPRFEIVYHLFSVPNNHRLRIKTQLSEKDLIIDSLTSLWRNANWLEREVFDMFGVHFKGHPDLRRIFMYDGFEGYPLRKDYPLRKRQPRIPLRK
ncbi:MAG: NADH-quinone oxidoreductase subunit C [Candidatus Aminicenantaceae bacterium]